MVEFVEMRKVTVNLPAKDLDYLLTETGQTPTELLRQALQVARQRLAYEKLCAARGTFKMDYIDKMESRADREIDYSGLEKLGTRLEKPSDFD